MGAGAGEGVGVGVGVTAGVDGAAAPPVVPVLACPPDAVLPPLVWLLPLFVFVLLCCFTTSFCTVKLYSAVMLSRYVTVMVALPAAALFNRVFRQGRHARIWRKPGR